MMQNVTTMLSWWLGTQVCTETGRNVRDRGTARNACWRRYSSHKGSCHSICISHNGTNQPNSSQTCCQSSRRHTPSSYRSCCNVQIQYIIHCLKSCDDAPLSSEAFLLVTMAHHLKLDHIWTLIRAIPHPLLAMCTMAAQAAAAAQTYQYYQQLLVMQAAQLYGAPGMANENPPARPA